MSTPASWYISPDGTSRQGPITDEQVRAMIAAGTLRKSSLLWREGLAAWTMLSDVAEFREASAGAQANLPTNMRLPATPGDLAPAPRKTSATVITLIVIGGILALCMLAAIPMGIMLPALGKARASAREIKDSTQVRGVHQGMILFAQNNSDLYALPSTLDKDHITVAEGELKDTPAHIMSIYMYRGYFSPELLVSPAEANPAFMANMNYQYSQPSAAASADKSLALWDPAFQAYPIEWTSAGPTRTGAGGLSYALMPPLGGREPKWSNTFSATEAIVGNRGPAYDAVGSGAGLNWSLHPDNGGVPTGNAEVGTNSYTLLIHGGRTTWEGNIAFNDNHVSFETRADPESLPFTFNGLTAGRTIQLDNLFVDENDSTRAKDSALGVNNANSNNFLRGWNYGEFDPKTGKLFSITSHLWFD